MGWKRGTSASLRLEPWLEPWPESLQIFLGCGGSSSPLLNARRPRYMSCERRKRGNDLNKDAQEHL